MGVGHVVATDGALALNARHVQNRLRRFALARGAGLRRRRWRQAARRGGVDRALATFVSQDVDLAVAALPGEMDPCDLLLARGADAFRTVLDGAVDALDFKLNRVLAGEGSLGVEGRRRAVESVLGVIALTPTLPGRAGAVKTQLMVNRIARRLALKEEDLWARLDELRKQRGGATDPGPRRAPAEDGAERKAPAAPEERQLLELLLAEPDLVSEAAEAVRPEEIAHPGLRRLLEGLYALLAEGESLLPRAGSIYAAAWTTRAWRNTLLNYRKSAGAIPTARPGCVRCSNTLRSAAPARPDRNSITSCSPPATTRRPWNCSGS